VRPDDARAEPREVAAFVQAINAAFPSTRLSMDDVTLVHCGVVPAVRRPDGTLTLQGHEVVQDHREARIDGLISVVGAKYTTARATAERVVNHVLEELQEPPRPCRSAVTPLPGGVLPDFDAAVEDASRRHAAPLPADVLFHLVAAYGTRAGAILRIAETRTECQARLSADSPVIGAELVHAARNELVVTLADAVVRRTPLGALGYPGDEAARQAADLVGDELAWDAARKADEVEALRRWYVVDRMLGEPIDRRAPPRSITSPTAP
jgi:glycerol-3-phosphate dehydrogenase